MDDPGATVVIIPTPDPEPVIIPEPEPVGVAVAEAISEVAEIDRMLDHESRISALESTLASHTHPEYETPDVAPIAEPIIDDIPPAPPEPEEIATPEPVEDSRPNRSHPLFARPFGGA
jgi:hypothetical protein